MKILIVNPNSTASMTAKIGAVAVEIAAPGTTVTAVNPPDTPASIECYSEEALCVPGLLRCIQDGEARGYDAYVIACFGDPGLDAQCRRLEQAPLRGIHVDGFARRHGKVLRIERVGVAVEVIHSFRPGPLGWSRTVSQQPPRRLHIASARKRAEEADDVEEDTIEKLKKAASKKKLQEPKEKY